MAFTMASVEQELSVDVFSALPLAWPVYLSGAPSATSVIKDIFSHVAGAGCWSF